MEQEKAQLEAQNTYLQEEIRSEHNFGEIVGSSPALLDVLRQVEQIARIDSTVLILGETGTGKELIARAIHDRSPRRNRALVKVNCGVRITASRCGFNGGPGQIPAALTRVPCSWTSPNAC